MLKLPEEPTAKLPLLERYNIAPTQDAPFVLVRENGERDLVEMRWGLIPPWKRDVKKSTGYKNSRAETVATSRAFGPSFRKRRGLVPASGFYEWAKTGKGKQPYFIHRARKVPMVFAAIWDHWDDPEGGGSIDGFSVITTGANVLMSPVHDRMPAMLSAKQLKPWLFGDESEASDILTDIKADDLELVAVSDYVNNARHQGPECVEPV